MVVPNTLYIVPTPIGNLADISQRAISVLQRVDVIAAEDTRHSQKLMQHLSISTPLMPLHEHNEAQKSKHLVSRLIGGESIALISDAGTPLISDPGYRLVNHCRDAGISVVALPGPCAAITALSASGLATDRFVFAGFLPVKDGAKRQAISSLEQEIATTVFYEAPRRIKSTLKMMSEILGDRHLVLAKEITKAFEHYATGDADTVLGWLCEDEFREKGEFVLMVSGASLVEDGLAPEITPLLFRLMDDLPLKKAASIISDVYNVKKNAVYQLGLTLKE